MDNANKTKNLFLGTNKCAKNTGASSEYLNALNVLSIVQVQKGFFPKLAQLFSFLECTTY